MKVLRWSFTPGEWLQWMGSFAHRGFEGSTDCLLVGWLFAAFGVVCAHQSAG